MHLTDTHLVLFSAAAQREDKLLVRPGKLGAKAADKLAARFVAAGLVETIVVTLEQPYWQINQDSEPVGLRATRSGLDALGIEPGKTELLASSDPADSESKSPGDDTPTQRGSDLASPDGDPAAGSETPEPSLGRNIIPRAGTKRALLIAMLQREEGASVENIMAAMGWLPHSTRAALTGLRKSGHHLAKSKDEAGRTIYHLIDAGAATGMLVNDVAEGCR